MARLCDEEIDADEDDAGVGRRRGRGARGGRRWPCSDAPLGEPESDGNSYASDGKKKPKFSTLHRNGKTTTSSMFEPQASTLSRRSTGSLQSRKRVPVRQPCLVMLPMAVPEILPSVVNLCSSLSACGREPSAPFNRVSIKVKTTWQLKTTHSLLAGVVTTCQ